MKKRKSRGLRYILPGFVGLCVFFIVPFAISIRYMFTKGISSVRFVGLENFTELFENPAFTLALKNTLIFMAVGVPVLTIGALFFAMMLQGSKNRLVRGALLAPMIMPVASALLGWSAIFGVGGVVGFFAKLFGAVPHDYLADPYARWVLIFIFVVKNLGYMTIIFSGAVNGMAKEYREVFSLDSRSTAKFTFKIVAPIISPVMFFVVILSVVNCFQIFREVFGLYGSYPPDSLYMLQNFMNNNFAKLNYNRLCTASFIVSMAIALIISLYLHFQRKAEKQEGGI